MSIIDQLKKSTLSLVGNGFKAQPNQPSWGYQSNIPNNPGGIEPEISELHKTYSINNTPDLRIKDFNRQALGGVTKVKPPTRLDELDNKAPNNNQAGMGGVVSQIYKSKPGRTYKDLGPVGRY